MNEDKEGGPLRWLRQSTKPEGFSRKDPPDEAVDFCRKAAEGMSERYNVRMKARLEALTLVNTAAAKK